MLKENEKWIPDMEGIYAANTEGEIISYKKGKRKILLGGMTHRVGKSDQKLYRMVCLTLKGMNRCHYVHRLVAKAFIPNPENKPAVNHKDLNKVNNRVENLEWVTAYENTHHARDNGVFPDIKLKPEFLSERADSYILRGDCMGVDYKSVEVMLTEEDFIRNHVPKEFLNVSKSHKHEACPLNLWNHYIDLFKLCESELSLSSVAKIVNMDQSMISLIRNGKRAKKARKIYEKYKDDLNYFVNYKPIYNYI